VLGAVGTPPDDVNLATCPVEYSLELVDGTDLFVRAREDAVDGREDQRAGRMPRRSQVRPVPAPGREGVACSELLVAVPTSRGLRCDDVVARGPPSGLLLFVAQTTVLDVHDHAPRTLGVGQRELANAPRLTTESHRPSVGDRSPAGHDTDSPRASTSDDGWHPRLGRRP
jgi:hypothetical protein